LAKKGAFRNLSVAMMAHPDSRTEPIKKMLALVELDIEFFGKESHAAAAPEKGINALDAAVATYQNILHYRKRFTKDARIHGIFTSAGTKPNIIPDYACLKYYIRALRMSDVEQMIRRIKSIAKREARRIGAETKFKINPLSYEPFYPNRILGKIFAKQLAFLRIKNEQGSETKRIGSSDVGNVGQRVPTIHPSIKICDHLSVHTRAFAKAALSDRGYKAMTGAAKALALTGYEVLSKPQTLKRINAEFKNMRK
jgi:metal-dependent amidase/aminoacylase/carboxypeptidase family protein